MNRERISGFKPVKATVSGSPAAGVIIDGQGFDSLTWVIILNAAGQPVYTVEHGDASNLSDATAVDASLLKTDSYGAGSTVHKVAYLGNKRYVRLTHTLAGTCVAELGHPSQQPV